MKKINGAGEGPAGVACARACGPRPDRYGAGMAAPELPDPVGQGIR